MGFCLVPANSGRGVGGVPTQSPPDRCRGTACCCHGARLQRAKGGIEQITSTLREVA